MKIFLAGHTGMVGSAILRQLTARINNGEQIEVITRTRSELDLTNQEDVLTFMQSRKPDAVILAAAKVGGIHANSTYPADFIYQNLMIQTNIIHASYSSGIRKLLFLGSSCIYPRMAKQPMKESALLSGHLEPTNEPYAIAKIAGIKMCESYCRQYGVDYRSVMPTNLYGKGDNFHPENSHVVPAFIRRFHEAKISNKDEVEIWGSGTPFREFLHVDDMAAASLFVLDLDKEKYEANTEPMMSHINVGSGQEITIEELANLVKNVVGYKGKIVFNRDMPDGAPRKIMDNTRINDMGWRSEIDIIDGLTMTYSWFKRFSGNLER